MEGIIIIILVSILFFLLYSFYLQVKKQKKPKILKIDNRNNSAKSGSNPKLNKKLLKLLNGDEKLALRLINNVRLKNPDKSYEWCQEKVILDLERDRRY